MTVRLERAFLRTRLGRRILAMFVLCALVPTGAALLLLYGQLDRRLADERRERVREQSKLSAEQVLMRIRIIDREFARTARRIATSPPEEWPSVADSATAQLIGLAAEAGLGDIVRIFGDPPEPPPVTDLVRKRLEDGLSVLATVPEGGTRSRVILVRQVELEDGPILMWGELSRERLEAETASFSAATRICLLDDRRVPIFCDLDLPQDALSSVGNVRTTAQEAYLDWSEGEARMVGAYAIVFLSFDFAAPPWVIVTAERWTSVLSRLSEFRLTMVMAGASALATVILLGSVQIRRSLEPLQRLTEGTQRVSEGNFAARVDVASRDEFEDLADSFNGMTERLDRQFRTLLTLRKIDEAVLEDPNLERVARASLSRAPELTGCTVASLVVKHDPRGGSSKALAFVHFDGLDRLQRIDGLGLGPHDDEILAAAGLAARTDETPLPCLDFPPLSERSEEFLAVGIRQQGELRGVLALGFPPESTDWAESLDEACQLAGQLAVALANVQLVSDLDRISVGALRALARTIDAKSAWTAGHSERVTRLARALGRELGLSTIDQDRLYRGGLLHDIGKLGVSEETLNWPGKLTELQWAEMRRHPEIGVEILEPIPAFADILPIVHSHHERWDGAGYPTGLAGEAIPFLARVVAVADVFDALTSDRPYRAGMPEEKAIEIIEDGAGSQFDRYVVDVLRPALSRLDSDEADQRPRPIAVGE